jgi:hypothetical protein
VAGGALLAVALLVPLSLLTGGRDAWSAFIADSRVHVATPLRNHMGLPTVLAFSSDEVASVDRAEDPFAHWKDSRRARFAAHRPLFAGLVLAYVALLTVAVTRQPLWVAATLGIGLVPVATELTSYYYAILLGFGFLWTRREAIGVALVGIAALSWAMVEAWHFYDVVFARLSLAVVCFVAAATALLARGAKTR